MQCLFVSTSLKVSKFLSLNASLLTHITAYIAANCVTVHDTNNAVIWAWTAAQEMVVWIEDSREFSNPSTSAIYELIRIRWELRVACSNASLNHTQEWHEHKAVSLGQPVEEIISIAISSETHVEVKTLQLFSKAAVTYNLILTPISGDNMLWNLCPYTISPTFSFPLTHSCISLSINSSPLWTSTRTFPHSSQMPCSLKQNSVPFLDAFLCFTFFVLICFTPPLVLWYLLVSMSHLICFPL